MLMWTLKRHEPVGVLTGLCRSCRDLLCLELKGHLGLDRKAMSIWTIKLEGRRIRKMTLSITVAEAQAVAEASKESKEC